MRELGGPDVLELVECDRPEPGQGEVLVAVARAGVNFADVYTRHGSYLGAAAEPPLIPGGEIAGVRADTGERVVALCGAGGYAEYAVAPAALCFPVPDAISDADAVALLVQGTTAWHLHRTAAHLEPGESVVVHSAAGGTGSLAVQLARAFGAGRVIGSASTDEKRALAIELGADAAIGVDATAMTEAILAANDGRPVDVVLDAIGGATFDASRAALAPFGRIVVYGIADGRANELRTSSLLGRSQGVIGFLLARCRERPRMLAVALEDLFRLAAAGTVRPVVGATYPLAQAARAQDDLQRRRTTGKLLLDPAA
jgi:NADPH:quinone reductase